MSIQHLKNEFVKEHANNITAATNATAEKFWNFAADYLNKHRMVENWPADRNIGIKLSNNVRVLIHPVTKAGSGDMQDSSSVSITEGQTQPGQEGVSGTKANHVT